MFAGTYPAARKPQGYRQQTVSTTAVPLSNVPASAVYALILVEGDSVRVRDDGVAPTSSAGMPFAATAKIELHSRKQINDFLAIRSGSGDATLNISYYSADRKAYE